MDKTANTLAQMIRDRQISSVELLDVQLAQIAQHNSKLNAICTLDADTLKNYIPQQDATVVARL